MVCRSCKSNDLDLVIDLGYHAWCNNFITDQEMGSEPTYPLRMVFCHHCSLCQLDTTVPKEIMFKEHYYVSGTTETLRAHFFSVAKSTERWINKKSYILDVGGNDGTFLQQYAGLGYKKLINVESARNIAEMSANNEISTVNNFFNFDLCKDLRWNRKFDIIHASGVFFHLEELHSVIQGIKYSLAPDGVFVVEFMYLGDMLNKLSFDGIYHEHLCYYSLRSLINLLKPYGLRVFDAKHCKIHGGSIIAYIGMHPKYEYSKRLVSLLSRDINQVNYKKLEKFERQVTCSWLPKFIDQVDMAAATGDVWGVGAPAKANTLLTYAGIDYRKVKAVFEVNKNKIGTRTPVTHIPIIKENFDLVKPNDTLLVLSWNFDEEISKKFPPVNVIYPFGN